MTNCFHRTSLEPYDSEQMARDFLIQFSNQIFTVGQQLAFSFQDKRVLALMVKNLEGKYNFLDFNTFVSTITTSVNSSFLKGSNYGVVSHSFLW